MRHELKYLVTQGRLCELRSRLQPLLELDTNSARGSYTVTSLYFDTFYNDCLFEKLAGNADRKKYRLRIYNHDHGLIKLEVKYKKNNLIYKHGAVVSRLCAKAMVAGDYEALLQSSNPLLKEVYVEFVTKAYRPKVIVEYDREAYVDRFDNTRITFDVSLRTFNAATDLFEMSNSSIPVILEAKEILEVKFTHGLQSAIRSLIQAGSAERMALSKYVMCRRYTKHSIWED